MTIRYITMNKVTEGGLWYDDTHLTPEEAIATLFQQGIDYPGSITKILKCENNFFTDITDKIGEESESSLLDQMVEGANNA